MGVTVAEYDRVTSDTGVTRGDGVTWCGRVAQGYGGM